MTPPPTTSALPVRTRHSGQRFRFGSTSADVPNSGQRSAAVVTQSPAAGSGVNFDAPITLAFAQ